DAELIGDLAKDGQLVGDAEVRVMDAERGAAVAARAHVAAGEHGDVDAELLQELDAIAVAYAEALAPRAVADPVEVTIGEHAVDDEAEQAHALEAGGQLGRG